MIRVTKQDFETFKRHKDPEVFTEATINNWILAHQETILKGDLEEVNDIEKAEIDAFNAEFSSMMKVEVVSQSDDLLSKGLKYETFYIRERQIEFEKAEGDEIQKSKHGRYLDTPLNRKMGRVGAEFGHETKKDDEDEKNSFKELKLLKEKISSLGNLKVGSSKRDKDLHSEYSRDISDRLSKINKTDIENKPEVKKLFEEVKSSFEYWK